MSRASSPSTRPHRKPTNATTTNRPQPPLLGPVAGDPASGQDSHSATTAPARTATSDHMPHVSSLPNPKPGTVPQPLTGVVADRCHARHDDPRPRDIRLEERPAPEITEPHQAVIKVVAACVCGSDLWPYRGENPIDEGSPIGHEAVGVIERGRCRRPRLQPGDFVVVPFVHCDNTCPHCRAGMTSACAHQGFTNGGQGSTPWSTRPTARW